ncbi:MAG: 50S ribosomal protein L10 [Candidatus Tectimicrobiota bacterium]
MVDPAKVEAVEDLREKFSRARAIVFADYRGLSVAQMNELRNRLRAEQVEFRVIKNTLARRAAADTPLAAVMAFIDGPTSVALSYDDVVAPARVLTEYAKEEKLFELKGGMLDGRTLDGEMVRRLADLPSRDVLQARLLSVLQSATVQFLGVLQGTGRGFLGALWGYAETKSS